MPAQRLGRPGASLSNEGRPLTEGLLALAPLETRQLQEDVSEDVLDAMRRTLSGMLGLLPSDNWTVLSVSLPPANSTHIQLLTFQSRRDPRKGPACTGT